MARKLFEQGHSSAWVVQTWLSFVISISATTIGILHLPANAWIRFMGMGLTFSIGSINLTKT